MDPLKNYDPVSPLVTVILRVHNGYTRYLPRAVKSVLNQDIPLNLIELFVVNDGPPSRLQQQYMVSLSDKNPKAQELRRLAHIWTEERTGYYCVPSNQVIPYALGYYLTFLDADNEYCPDHLSTLLREIRVPGVDGIPHFAYVRRRYVRDEGAPDGLPEGDSPFMPWYAENIRPMLENPQANFIDSGDFIIGKGTMYELAERTGVFWNPNIHRFGDWELCTRFVKAGFRGRAVNKVTHIYHWHSKNLQHTRPPEYIVSIAEDIADSAIREA